MNYAQRRFNRQNTYMYLLTTCAEQTATTTHPRDIPLLLPTLQDLSRLFKITSHKMTPVAVFFAAAGGEIVGHNFGVGFGELFGYG